MKRLLYSTSLVLIINLVVLAWYAPGVSAGKIVRASQEDAAKLAVDRESFSQNVPAQRCSSTPGSPVPPLQGVTIVRSEEVKGLARH